MKMLCSGSPGFWMVPLVFALLAEASWAHVTLRPNQPLRPGGFATVTMSVPNERHVDTTRVTLEIPEAFLKAGGRLSRVEYPPGWQVKLEKEDKPGEIYQHEMDGRARREAKREAGGEQGTKAAKTEAEAQEQQILDEMRKKWIKKVTFEGASIPPDGFKGFLLSLELPDSVGEFRFPSVQTYSDGKEVSWSELVQGAEHPAPTIVIERQYDVRNLALLLSGVALLVSLAQPLNRYRQHNKAQADSSVPVART